MEKHRGASVRRRNTYSQRTNGRTVEDWQGRREKAARGWNQARWSNLSSDEKISVARASERWMHWNNEYEPRCFSLSLSLFFYLSFLARWHLIFRTSTLIWLILLLSASNIRDREKGRESRRFLRILLFAVKLLERNLPSVLQLPDALPSRLSLRIAPAIF